MINLINKYQHGIFINIYHNWIFINIYQHEIFINIYQHWIFINIEYLLIFFKRCRGSINHYETLRGLGVARGFWFRFWRRGGLDTKSARCPAVVGHVLHESAPQSTFEEEEEKIMQKCSMQK